MQTRSKLFLTVVFGALTVAAGFAVTGSIDHAQQLIDTSAVSQAHFPAESQLPLALPADGNVPIASKSFLDMLKSAHP